MLSAALAFTTGCALFVPRSLDDVSRVSPAISSGLYRPRAHFDPCNDIIDAATGTTTLLSKSYSIPLYAPPSHANVAVDLPRTSIIAHAPGWTLFRNLYMSIGTLYILSSNPSFPKNRLMTSTGLPWGTTPENIASREPNPQQYGLSDPRRGSHEMGRA